MQSFLVLAYLVAAVLFIIGLKMMSHPRTAVRGNLSGAFGMAIAIVASCLDARIQDYRWIALGLVVGSAIGVWKALRVQMTAMPQMVAILNGLGGGASTLVAWADLRSEGAHPTDSLIAIGLSGLIGAITFWGSLMAYVKLEEWAWFKRPHSLPAQQWLNAALLIATLGLTGCIAWSQDAGIRESSYLAIVLLASVLGIMLVNPIGGADMPVVISLMNSYSGLAGAATGFVIDNNVLIISGSLVGASGVILTQIMCKAMNRSLTNVLFGGMGGGASSGPGADSVYSQVRSTSADDVALMLSDAQRVVVVPGYGMAVAQAQHAVRDLARLLEARGIDVTYAIHPVAGRMPGHMNVLLAEANIPYEKLKEMDEINPTLETVDVALVIGANDVVNPLARTDPNSPIAGMPIIDVDKCRTVVIIKRSLSPGFANIPNPLFAAPNALMLYADGQKALIDIAKAFKELS